MIKLHPSAYVSDLADIENSIKGSIISIGEDSYVDSFVKIKAAGGLGNISIGKSTYINSGTVIYIGNGVFIGDHVSVAANCVIAPTNHEFSNAEIPHQFQGFMPSKGGISIEDDVWIGAGSIILDGSALAKGSVIGAGSVVRGLTDPFGIYVGNPLRKIGSRS
jgi:virginiamycin A acetyltransferase